MSIEVTSSGQAAPTAGAHSAAAADRPASQAYYTQINALRVLAVATVLGDHYLNYQITRLGISGSHGVYLFFVISGFLITGILLGYKDKIDAGHSSVGAALKTFYARRSLRIFPLYYLMLGIMLLIGQVTFSGYFLSLLTYTQNIHIAIHNDWGPIGHFWSLATEEQFYFVWPLIVFLAPRRFLAPGLIAAAAVAIGFRLYGTATGMGLGDYTLPIASLDTLSLGALLALLHHSGETRLRGMLHRYGAWLLLAPVAMIFAPKQIGFLNATAIGLASLYLIEASVAGFKGAVGKAFELPPIVYLGQISYGIYVFHRVAPLIVPHQLADLFGANLRPYAEAGIYTLVTIALAALSWRFFEKPINDLKDRIRL